MLLIKEVEKKSDFKHFSKYRVINKVLKHSENETEQKEALSSFNMTQITNEQLEKQILEQKPLNHRPKKGKGGFDVFKKDSKYYIAFKTKQGIILTQDKIESSDIKPFITLIFIGIFIVLILSFLFTIKKLYPLKTLQDKVKSIGEENFDAISTISSKKDEVSILFNEFVKSSQNLKKIKEARNVFFRNIMHELKTPIAKGKFLLELEQNEKNRAKQKDIFNRLDLLINEFASIEAIVSKSTKPTMGNFFIADIIENVQDMLLLDENSLHVNIQNQPLHVNFKFFCIAIKNLVDNAIKHSPNKHATIYNKNKNIIIENIGNKLPKELKAYKEPYNNMDKTKQNSFGLGLYIVLHLLEANNYTLEYDHKEGKNIFTCKSENSNITNK